MTKKEFADWTAKSVILMDGATGSNLMAAGMPQNGATEIWMLEHPDIVQKLQSEYVQAGSQMVYACTFSANRKSLKKHGLEKRTRELNEKLVLLTKNAVDGRAYVAGDLTMTGELLEPLGDMTEEDLVDVYQEQIEALVKSGADLLGVETMMSLNEVLAALKAAEKVCSLPVMCTFTVNEQGRTLYGTDVVEAVPVLEEAGAAAVGINCSLGPDQLLDVVKRLKARATVPVIAKPNAGLPTLGPAGEMIYSMDAETFAVHMKELAEAGAGLIGGCCGTTPAYIRKVKETMNI
ncbi:MAG: homocysteine S-methyltransferase family protein [Ruminococcus sp.]|jgi:5-methyltetrahydrofolate--homocysteine methyltransferase